MTEKYISLGLKNLASLKKEKGDTVIQAQTSLTALGWGCLLCLTLLTKLAAAEKKKIFYLYGGWIDQMGIFFNSTALEQGLRLSLAKTTFEINKMESQSYFDKIIIHKLQHPGRGEGSAKS